MMDARILIKNSTSKCNKELLQFLHQNISSIKKKNSLKVVVVYDELIPKLNNKVDKLPVLILDGKLITGISMIKQNLMSSQNVNKETKAPKAQGVCDDLEDYWNAEMHSGVDDSGDKSEDLMESVKQRALDQSMEHRENKNKKEKRRDTSVSSTKQDNIKMEKINGDRISDMVNDDPMMKKFWDNQECTPGFE